MSNGDYGNIEPSGSAVRQTEGLIMYAIVLFGWAVLRGTEETKPTADSIWRNQ